MFKSNKWSIKLVLIFLVFFLVVIGSEILYLAKNRPLSLGAYFLYPAKWLAMRGDAEKAMYFTKKAGSIAIYFSSTNYLQKIPRRYSPSINIAESSFKQKYLDKVGRTDVLPIAKQTNTDLSRFFYDLALLAYSENDLEISKMSLTYALYLNPKLSHYHVELANMYLLEKDVDTAKKILTSCQEFNFPKTHCKDYLDNNLFWIAPEPVGFLNDAINNHYTNP